MSVNVNLVELQKNNVSAGVPVDCDMQSYDPTWIEVYYGTSRIKAVYNTDYTVSLDGDLLGFQLTPTASLITKITALGEGNVIFVVRNPPPVTDFTENDGFLRAKIVYALDKVYMAMQWNAWYATRTALGGVLSTILTGLSLATSTAVTAADTILIAIGKLQAQITAHAATLAGFNESVDDRVASLLVAGANVTLTYNDGAGTLTVASTGGGGGGASVTISDTAPGAPAAGNLWWNSADGVMYIYYSDGTSSQWVEANPTGVMTAAEILSSLLTVDGAASGLDADLLDGLSSAAFALASHAHAQADITNLVSDLAAKVPTSRTVTGTGALNGGGDLSANRTLDVADNGITNAKLADIATARIKGRVTAATGDPEDLTGTQTTTLLDVFTSALKGLVPASGGGTTNFLRADGTFAVPAGGSADGLGPDGDKGDITVGGTGTTLTIDANAVTLAKMAQIATARFLGRVTAATGNVEELTAANAKTILALVQADIAGLTTADSPQFTALNIGHATDTTLARSSAGNLSIEGNVIHRTGGVDVPIADGGTGQSTATAAFDALSPLTTHGDIIFRGASNNVRLAAGTNGWFLKSQGAGADPIWAAIAGGGDALVANPLSQFAATTSLELKGVISDETGSGALVFATSPTLVTPALGTPSALVLTNATGLPLAAVLDSTTEALGVGTLEVGHATDTTVARVSAGDLSIEGNIVYRAGGTDVPVADGGTGSSTAAGAATNLGLGTGDSPQHAALNLGHASDTTLTRVSAGLVAVEGVNLVRSTDIDNTKIAGINFVIDGGGAAITTGVKGFLEIPFACTINRVTLLADQSGSIVVDIWKDTYANYPPVDADSITASAVPTISAATKSQDSTLTGWTTAIAAGDVLGFNVDSITTCQRVTLSLKVTKT